MVPRSRCAPAAGPLGRLEATIEAIRRAVLGAGGAVGYEQVRATLREEPELAPLEPSNLSNSLAHLRRQGRVVVIATERRSGAGRGRNYYTLPGLGRVVARDEQNAPDAVLRVARELWKLAGTRPFTTSALRRFGQPRLKIAQRPRTFWANAVLALEARGDLRRARVLRHGAGVRVWWAVVTDPETESACSLSEPDVGTLGTLTTFAACAPDRLLMHRGPDVDFVSCSSDTRTLVLAAKTRAADLAGAEKDRAVLGARPVTFTQLWSARADCHGLGPRTRRALADALHATAHSVCAAQGGELVRLPSSAGPVWYDLAADVADGDGIPRQAASSAETFVRFHEARGAANDPWLERARLELLAVRLRAGAVPPGVLLAREQTLALELHGRARALEDAASKACLLPLERDGATALATRLDRDRRHILDDEQWAPPDGTPPPAATGDLLLDLDDAYHWLESLGLIRLPSARLLPSRFPTVRVVRMSASSEAGRPRAYFDRVDFVCYCLGAYSPGASRLASWARRGRFVLGALRESAPLIEALQFDALVPSASGIETPGVLAALGLLDDLRSRDALVRFLADATTSLTQVEGRAEAPRRPSHASLEAALIGLARRPVGGQATELRVAEESILCTLGEVAGRRGYSEIAALSRHVRTTWVTEQRIPNLMI